MPLSSAMLEVAWLRNILPRDSHSGIYGRKAFGRGGEKTSSGERPSKYFKPAKFEGTGEVLAGVSGSRAAVSLACAERCTTWAETRRVARTEAGCVAQVMPGPGDVSPRAQPGLRSHTPQGVLPSAPASCPPRIRPPTAGREPVGDLHLAEQRLFASDLPLFTTWESPSRARAVGQMGKMRHGTAPSHPVLSYFSLFFFFLMFFLPKGQRSCQS